jgi:hypothetical protein
MWAYSETATVRDYFERLRDRRRASLNREALHCCVWKILRSADRHLERFDQARQRYQAALDLKDHAGVALERDNMLALLYETADTVFLIMQMFDLDSLDLHASSDGVGFAGEDAPFLRDTLDKLNSICAKVLELSSAYDLKLDFSKAVDEREHVTYESHAHWRGLVPGSAEKSFFVYFAHARQEVAERLNRVPKFWHNQTLMQALKKSPRVALRVLVQKLLMASFPRASLAESLEKESTATRVQRHLGHGPNQPEWIRPDRAD